MSVAIQTPPHLLFFWKYQIRFLPAVLKTLLSSTQCLDLDLKCGGSTCWPTSLKQTSPDEAAGSWHWPDDTKAFDILVQRRLFAAGGCFSTSLGIFDQLGAEDSELLSLPRRSRPAVWTRHRVLRGPEGTGGTAGVQGRCVTGDTDSGVRPRSAGMGTVFSWVGVQFHKLVQCE